MQKDEGNDDDPNHVTSPLQDMGRPKRRRSGTTPAEAKPPNASFVSASTPCTVKGGERDAQGKGVLFVRSDSGRAPMTTDLGFLHRFEYVDWKPSGVRQLTATPDGEWLALARASGDVEIWESHHWTLLKVQTTQWSGMHFSSCLNAETDGRQGMRNYGTPVDR